MSFEQVKAYLAGLGLNALEFDVLKSINSYTIEQKMRQYIKKYKKAKQHINISRNRNIVKFSTLQYFEDYI